MAIQTKKEKEEYEKGAKAAEEILQKVSENLPEYPGKNEQLGEIKSNYQSLMVGGEGQIVKNSSDPQARSTVFPGYAEGYLNKMVDLGLNSQEESVEKISPEVIYQHVVNDVLQKTNPDLISENGIREKLHEYEKNIEEGPLKIPERENYERVRSSLRKMESRYDEKSPKKDITNASSEDIREELESFQDPEVASIYLKENLEPEVENYSDSLSEEFKNSFYQTLGEAYEKTAEKYQNQEFIPNAKQNLLSAREGYEKAGYSEKAEEVSNKIRELSKSYEERSSDSYSNE